MKNRHAEQSEPEENEIDGNTERIEASGGDHERHAGKSIARTRVRSVSAWMPPCALRDHACGQFDYIPI